MERNNTSLASASKTNFCNLLSLNSNWRLSNNAWYIFWQNNCSQNHLEFFFFFSKFSIHFWALRWLPRNIFTDDNAQTQINYMFYCSNQLISTLYPVVAKLFLKKMFQDEISITAREGLVTRKRVKEGAVTQAEKPVSSRIRIGSLFVQK